MEALVLLVDLAIKESVRNWLKQATKSLHMLP